MASRRARKKARRQSRKAAGVTAPPQTVGYHCICGETDVFHLSNCPAIRYEGRKRRNPLVIAKPEHTTAYTALTPALGGRQPYAFAKCNDCGYETQVKAKGKLPKCPGCGKPAMERVAYEGERHMANTWCHVTHLEDCDICKVVQTQFPGLYEVGKARIDGKTNRGPWAKMCVSHYLVYGIGLGIGKGQYLLLHGESIPEWVPKR